MSIFSNGKRWPDWLMETFLILGIDRIILPPVLSLLDRCFEHADASLKLKDK